MSHQNNDFNHKRTFSQKRIHQAKSTVNAFLAATVLSGIVTLSGVCLAISGYIPEGVKISEVGMVSTVELTKRLKDANNRLEKTIKDTMHEDEAERNK
ncbi:MAG: TRADD-N-associated membrane domain-containing protein [Brasilonema sp.]